MEKTCEIRKFINSYELINIFYKFLMENEIYRKYTRKLRISRYKEIGEFGLLTYLMNEASKAKTTEAYIKTPFYVLSFDDYKEYDYWIENIMISWLSFINKYIDSCNYRTKTIALLIRFIRENNITRKFKTKLMSSYSFFDDSESKLINILKKIEPNNAQDEINITTLISVKSYEEYQFYRNIQKKWQKFYDNFSKTI